MNFKEEQQDALREDNMTAYINAKAGELMESLGDIVVYSLIQMYMVEKHYMVCREMLGE